MIKIINNPNASTLLDIARILTTPNETILMKYDDKLLYGYIRSINKTMVIDGIIKICISYLNDDKQGILKPISNDWKWGYKILRDNKSNSQIPHKKIEKCIYDALMDILKDKSGWKCLFVVGQKRYRKGNISQDWDTFDIWWLLNKNIEEDNCILCRFHRYWYENDK